MKDPGAKVIDWTSLVDLRKRWRQENKVVVWTNGCFDLFHFGHLQSLQAARRLGDLLIVGINDDASVQKLKGAGRPILAAVHRAQLLAGFECVDQVVVFEDLTPEASLARLQPDIHCKGADYAPPNGKPIPEVAVVESYGGRVAFLPLVAEISTSQIIQRIHQLKSHE